MRRLPLLLLGLGLLLAGFGAGWLLFGGLPAPPPPGQASTPDSPATAPAPGSAGRASSPAPGEGRPGEGGPAGEAGGAPPPAPGPGPSSSGGGLSLDRTLLRAEVERSLREEFRAKAGRELPEDALRAQVDAMLKNLEANLPSIPDRTAMRRGVWLAGRELLRDEAGSLSNPVEIVLQLRGSGRRGRSDILGIPAGDHLRAETIASGPLDMKTPVRREERMAAFVKGGLLPLGKAMVVERIELTALPGVELTGPPGVTPPLQAGEIRLEFDGQTLVERPETTTPFRVVWSGVATVREGEEDRTLLEVSRGAAEVRILGRLIDEAAAADIKREPMTAALEESTGFLAGGRIVLQVMADHGGGNPQRLFLDGTTNGRFRTISPEDLSLRLEDLSGLRDGVGHLEGGGVIPPGRRLVVRRVDIRAKVLPGGGGHGRVVVRVDGKTVFETTDTGGELVFSSWSEEATVDAGGEREVYVEAAYFAFVEAVLTTEVE